MKKRKIKRSNVVITALSLSLIILIIITSIFVSDIIKDTFGKGKSKEVEIVDTIKNYSYQLTEYNTEYFKKLYYELKDVLSETESDSFDKDYASLVAQLFIADFYDLNSKLNKNDIGGVQFVYSEYQEDFKNFASDSTGIYYYVENNIYGDRNQELPSVKEVEVTEITTINYIYGDVNDTNAYKIKVHITYDKDLGYPTSEILTLIHNNNNKIEVVKMN